MDISQGDIFTANLNPIKGNEQAGFRPVLVIQNNILNRNLNTVIIVPITSNLKAKGRLTTYLLNKKNSGLEKESLALLFQIWTLDKIRLNKKIGKINQKDLDVIKIQTFMLFK